MLFLRTTGRLPTSSIAPYSGLSPSIKAGSRRSIVWTIIENTGSAHNVKPDEFAHKRCRHNNESLRRAPPGSFALHDLHHKSSADNARKPKVTGNARR